MHPGKRAPEERVVFKPKVFVIYRAPGKDDFEGLLIPVHEVDYLSQEIEKVSYAEWAFDTHFAFLGKLVTERAYEIMNKLIWCTSAVSNSFYFQSKQTQLHASLRAIRKYYLKLLRRYAQGSFITKHFLSQLRSFTESISNGIVWYLRSESRQASVKPCAVIS